LVLVSHSALSLILDSILKKHPISRGQVLSARCLVPGTR
jgi:hypothetical protein